MTPPGKLTVYGDAECEMLIRSELDMVVKGLRNRLCRQQLLSIVLIGGYGRGEGGVQKSGGKLFPHNNYDFLVVLKRIFPIDRSRVQKALNFLKGDLKHKLTVDVDFSFMTLQELKTARFRLLLCDAKHAAQVLWGEVQVLDFLPDMPLARVPRIEGRWLLLNRGVLLLLNEQEVQNQGLVSTNQQWLFRHIAKSIIGCGDAVLIGLGAYHWSYQEKRDRLVQLEAEGKLPVGNLGKWYSMALEWRLQSSIGNLGQEKYFEMQSLAKKLNEECYLWYEKSRGSYLGSSFEGYGKHFPKHIKALVGEYLSTRPLSTLGRIFFPYMYYFMGCLKGLRFFGLVNNWLGGFLWGFLPPRDRLLAVYPELAFSKGLPGERLGRLIGLRNVNSRRQVLSGFLELWSKACA